MKIKEDNAPPRPPLQVALHFMLKLFYIFVLVFVFRSTLSKSHPVYSICTYGIKSQIYLPVDVKRKQKQKDFLCVFLVSITVVENTVVLTGTYISTIRPTVSLSLIHSRSLSLSAANIEAVNMV